MMAMAELADKLGVDYRTMVERTTSARAIIEILKGSARAARQRRSVGSCGLDEAIARAAT